MTFLPCFSVCSLLVCFLPKSLRNIFHFFFSSCLSRANPPHLFLNAFPFCIFVICRFSCFLHIGFFPPFPIFAMIFSLVPAFCTSLLRAFLTSVLCRSRSGSPSLLSTNRLTLVGKRWSLFFTGKTLFSSPVGCQKDQANVFALLLHEGLWPYVVWVW